MKYPFETTRSLDFLSVDQVLGELRFMTGDEQKAENVRPKPSLWLGAKCMFPALGSGAALEQRPK